MFDPHNLLPTTPYLPLVKNQKPGTHLALGQKPFRRGFNRLIALMRIGNCTTERSQAHSAPR